MPIARYLGWAEEATYGTYIPAAVQHVDAASISLDTPGDTEMVYGGGLQRSASVHRPGFYAPSGNFVFAFDIASIGYFLKWVLGGYAYTVLGGTPPTLNLHEFWGSEGNVPMSFTAFAGKDLFEHIFAGCVVNSLGLEMSGEWCTATVDIVAAKDKKGTLLDIDALTLPTQYPLAFHEVTCSLGGVASSAKVKSFKLDISNGASADSGRGLGSRHPYRVVAGERETTFSMELFYEDTAAIEAVWGDAAGVSDDGTTESNVELTFDAGADGTMTITLPRTIYSSVSTQPSGREELTQSVAGRAFLDEYTLEDASVVSTEIGVNISNAETVYGVEPA